MNYTIKTEDVKAAIKGREAELFHALAGIPADILDGWKYPCPFCGGQDRFNYRNDTGRIYCRQCAASGLDIFAAIQLTDGVGFQTALTKIADYLNVSDTVPVPLPKAVKANTEPAKPIKQTEWIYRHSNGEPAYRISRTDFADGTKKILQFRYENGQYIAGMDGTELLPLRLPELCKEENHNRTLCITEGELCCDALQALSDDNSGNLIVTTASGGTNTKLRWSDFVDVLQPYSEILFFPDNDSVGWKYINRVANEMREAGLPDRIKIVLLTDDRTRTGFDVADWINEGGDYERLTAVIQDTPVWDGLPLQWDNADERSDDIAAPAADDETPNYRVVVTSFSNIKSIPVSYLWNNRIPSRKITVIAGKPGEGKSFFTVYLSAIITNGWRWCDGEPCESGSVLFFAEDRESYKPRLIANGVRLDRAFVFEEVVITRDGKERKDAFSMGEVDYIRTSIKETARKTGCPVRMVVFDPLARFLGDKKENSNGDIHSLLDPLSELAAELDTAIIAIQHTGKNNAAEFAAHKIIGSTGIVACARAVWSVYQNPNVRGQRYFSPTKSNDLVKPTAVLWTINQEAGGRVEIIDANVENNSDDIEADNAAARQNRAGRNPSELESARDWLSDFLQNGRQVVSDIESEAEAAGHSKGTIRRAANALSIQKTHEERTYFWELPMEF